MVRYSKSVYHLIHMWQTIINTMVKHVYQSLSKYRWSFVSYENVSYRIIFMIHILDTNRLQPKRLHTASFNETFLQYFDSEFEGFLMNKMPSPNHMQWNISHIISYLGTLYDVISMKGVTMCYEHHLIGKYQTIPW